MIREIEKLDLAKVENSAFHPLYGNKTPGHSPYIATIPASTQGVLPSIGPWHSAHEIPPNSSTDQRALAQTTDVSSDEEDNKFDLPLSAADLENCANDARNMLRKIEETLSFVISAHPRQKRGRRRLRKAFIRFQRNFESTVYRERLIDDTSSRYDWGVQPDPACTTSQHKFGNENKLPFSGTTILAEKQNSPPYNSINCPSSEEGQQQAYVQPQETALQRLDLLQPKIAYGNAIGVLHATHASTSGSDWLPSSRTFPSASQEERKPSVAFQSTEAATQAPERPSSPNNSANLQRISHHPSRLSASPENSVATASSQVLGFQPRPQLIPKQEVRSPQPVWEQQQTSQTGSNPMSSDVFPSVEMNSIEVFAETEAVGGIEHTTAPRKPRDRRRTKAGCMTCRKRRIKCDEERPICNNCIKSKRRCEGYDQRVVFRSPNTDFRVNDGSNTIPFHTASLTHQSFQQQLIHPGKVSITPSSQAQPEALIEPYPGDDPPVLDSSAEPAQSRFLETSHQHALTPIPLSRSSEDLNLGDPEASIEAIEIGRHALSEPNSAQNSTDFSSPHSSLSAPLTGSHPVRMDVSTPLSPEISNDAASPNSQSINNTDFQVDGIGTVHSRDMSFSPEEGMTNTTSGFPPFPRGPPSRISKRRYSEEDPRRRRVPGTSAAFGGHEYKRENPSLTHSEESLPSMRSKSSLRLRDFEARGNGMHQSPLSDSDGWVSSSNLAENYGHGSKPDLAEESWPLHVTAQKATYFSSLDVQPPSEMEPMTNIPDDIVDQLLRRWTTLRSSVLFSVSGSTGGILTT